MGLGGGFGLGGALALGCAFPFPLPFAPFLSSDSSVGDSLFPSDPTEGEAVGPEGEDEAREGEEPSDPVNPNGLDTAGDIDPPEVCGDEDEHDGRFRMGLAAIPLISPSWFWFEDDAIDGEEDEGRSFLEG